MPRRATRVDGPDAVDIHVGSRVRLRRMLLGMSQQDLGEKIGFTFQQVQKYEKGVNRLSASVLWRVSEALDVPVSFFFDGLSESSAGGAMPDTSRRYLTVLPLLERAPEGVREAVVGILRSVVTEEDEEEAEEPRTGTTG